MVLSFALFFHATISFNLRVSHDVYEMQCSQLASSLDALVLRHEPECILTVAVELEEVVVVLPEGLSVTDRDERDALLLHVSVQVAFDIDGDGACAFIKDSVQGLVIDQSSHSHALLLSTR